VSVSGNDNMLTSLPLPVKYGAAQPLDVIKPICYSECVNDNGNDIGNDDPRSLGLSYAPSMKGG
jgi:hypothetical protein